jgi:anti-sigma regulatory factor (Ser/Thr protein kinase)
MGTRANRTNFHHEAFFYEDADEFLAGTVPFLEDGLEAGEPALVAVGAARRRALEAELAGTADKIRFVDMEELGRNPARIIPVWRQFVDEHGGSDRPIRGIGEPVWPGRTEAEIDECQRHESLLNHAFWEGPAWRLLCPYDSARLHDAVLEAARHSHTVVSGNWTRAEDAQEHAPAIDPKAVAPFAGVLPRRPPEATVFAFGRDALRDARKLVAAEAERRGFSPDRCFDLVAAVGELTSNSVVHGGGTGELSFWMEDAALVIQVADAGVIDEPLTGRLRPEPSQHGGRGLWMVNHLCDLVQLRTGPDGTTVRARMAAQASA